MATTLNIRMRVFIHSLKAIVMLAFAANVIAQTNSPSTPLPVIQNQVSIANRLPSGPLILQTLPAPTKKTQMRRLKKNSNSLATRTPNGKPPQPNAANVQRDPRIVGYGLELLSVPPESSPKPRAEPQSREASPKKPAEQRAPTTTGPVDRQPNTIPKSVLQPAKCDMLPTEAQIVPQFEEITKKYCTSNSSALEQARLNWQKAELEALEQRVKLGLHQLDKRIEELQALRKEIAIEKTKEEQKVVAIIAEMRPDAAALQISAMDPSAAVSVLAGLPPKAASLILNEMQPKQAAQLTQAMTEVRSRGRSLTSASQ